MTTLKFTMTDCVDRVRINIKEGATDVVKGLTGSSDANGSVTIQLLEDLDPAKTYTISIEVLSVKHDPRCEGVVAAGHVYHFSGMIQLDEHAGFVDLGIFQETPIPGGTVSGGKCPTNAGYGLGLFVTLDGTGCRRTCFEQWIKAQVFVITPGGSREIFNGVAFTDKSGHQQRYGDFGRDIPRGSPPNSHCYREDPIPGKPNQRGLLDLPGVGDEDVPELYRRAVKAAERAHPAISTADPFTVRFEFTAFSIVWCTNPTPEEIIGYFSWTSIQELAFTHNSGGGVTVTLTRRITSGPTWTRGEGTLTGPMKEF